MSPPRQRGAAGSATHPVLCIRMGEALVAPVFGLHLALLTTFRAGKLGETMSVDLA